MEISADDLIHIIGQMQIKIILLEQEIAKLKKGQENGTVPDRDS